MGWWRGGKKNKISKGKNKKRKMDSKAGNRVFDPLTDVRGLDREKRILDSCFRRNDQRAREWNMGT